MSTQKIKPQLRSNINIDKDAYVTIKQYCDDNAFSLPKWLVKIALEKISENNKKL